MTWLAVVAVLSIFSGIEEKVSGIVVRPFDFVAAFMALALIWKLLSKGRIRIPMGLFLMVPFIVIHVLSAASVTTGNGVREALQMCVVMAFLLAYANADNPCPSGRTWWLLFVVTWFVLLFNIGWHLDHGFWSGWKRLDELKHAFAIATLLTFIWVAKRGFRPNLMQILLFGFLGGAIVLSGERKALVIYGLATIMILSAVRSKGAIFVLLVPIAFVSAALFFFVDDYVLRQLSSLGFSGGYTPSGLPSSLSNEQRIFAFKVGMELFSESPVVGIGTNQYKLTINSLFSYYPAYLRTGIHGEFFRVFVENGLLGFGAYMAIWFASIVRTLRLARRMRLTGLMTAAQNRGYLYIYAMTFLTGVAICGLEASGTESFLYLGLISLWPDLTKLTYGLRSAPLRGRSAPVEFGRV